MFLYFLILFNINLTFNNFFGFIIFNINFLYYYNQYFNYFFISQMNFHILFMLSDLIFLCNNLFLHKYHFNHNCSFHSLLARRFNHYHFLYVNFSNLFFFVFFLLRIQYLMSCLNFPYFNQYSKKY